MRRSYFLTIAAAGCIGLCTGTAEAVNLTNLNTGTAVFAGTPADITNQTTFTQQLAAQTDANGFTFNVSFTPTVADLTGTTLLMEIGGTTNGSGLYLVNGVPVLALKTAVATALPSSETTSDTNFADGAATIFSSYGKITAGNAFSVAGTWGLSNLYSLAVQDDTAQFSTLDSLTITGRSATSYNWSGNDTLSVGNNDTTVGNRGGMADAAGSAFSNTAPHGLAGAVQTAGAVYWNARATLAVSYGAPTVPKLTINRDSGNVTFTNSTANPISLIGYSIETASGGFDRNAWQRVDALDVNDEWFELTQPGNPTLDLSEATFGEYTVAPGGGQINFGNAWIRSPFEDLQFEFRDANGAPITMAIEYTGHGGQPFALGDFNGLNGIDTADWITLRGNLISDIPEVGIAGYVKGDINVDGLVNELDFTQFKSAYDATHGAGSFNLMVAGLNVPEPASLALVALGSCVLLNVRRRRVAGLMLVMLAVNLTTSRIEAANLFSDSFDRAVAQVDDIDATSTGMSGTLAPMTYVENGDDIVPTAPLLSLTNIQDNQLQLADGPNATAMYLNHNFVDSAITTDGVLSIKMNLLRNWGNTAENERFIGFGVGATLSQFQAQTLLDFNATADAPALRGTVNAAADGFADFWFGWSPANNGVIQIVKNGALTRTVSDGVNNFADPVAVPAIPIQPGTAFLQPTTLEVRMAVGNFNAGTVVPATIYYNGVAVATDAFRWDNTNANYIGIAARQELEGWTADDLAITTSTTPIDLLTPTLHVNTASGEVMLKGGSQDVTVDYYKITSPSNSLVQGSFNGIRGDSGVPAGNGTGNGWELGGVQTSALLNEFYLGATGSEGTVLGAGFSASLGNIYSGTARDLMVELHLTDGTTVFGGSIYSSAPALPDFNGNGRVDAADYTVWRDNFGVMTGATLSKGDANNDGKVDSADYNLWKASFGLHSGAGAGLSESGAVPEPASIVMLGVVALGGVAGLRQRGKSY